MPPNSRETAGILASNWRYLLVIPIALVWMAPLLITSPLSVFSLDPMALSVNLGLLIASVISGLCLIYAFSKLNGMLGRMTLLVLYLIAIAASWVVLFIGVIGIRHGPTFEEVPFTSVLFACLLTPLPLLVALLGIGVARRKQNTAQPPVPQEEES